MKTSCLKTIRAARIVRTSPHQASSALSALCILAMLGACGTADAATSYFGWVTTSTTDAYVNRCAVDPVNSISTLPTNPTYVMAYRSGSDTCSNFAPTTGNGMVHRQGIQRLTIGGQNYLLVTMSTNNGVRPGFEVIRLGSRTGTTGLLGGNVIPHQYPSCADAVARYQADDTGRDHAGGFQVSGEYAIVPLERINDSMLAGFRTAQLSAPSTPSWSPMVTRQRSQTTNAGAAGMTRLSNGLFMAMVFGNNSDDVEVFVSSSTSLPGHNGSTSTWVSMASANTPFGGGNYQGLQLITKCDGQLYVAGTHKDINTDWVDLWRVDLNPSYVPTFVKVANRHMYCSTSNTGNTRYCDFQAGAGTYVNGTGGLHLYGVEHYNDGVSGTTRVVKVREF
ncbi:MAG: hypothetical protein E6Q88_01020 [Lysobacteraceae bacterium]|nr:MAG: hypothetical protein E6Q88_01020 [Xanthomonadaceae bacterium]